MNKRYIADDTVKQALGTELAFDVFVVLDGREVRLVMEPVWVDYRDKH